MLALTIDQSCLTPLVLLITIPNRPGDMPEGTLRAILKQAGIETEAFLRKK